MLSLSVFTMLGVATIVAPSASADIDKWSCGNYSSAQTCWAGTGYRGYKEINATIGTTRSEICAKSQTSAGNVRTGSGCNYNAWTRVSCLSSETPNSAAYVYWAGSGYAINVYGEAATPSSTPC